VNDLAVMGATAPLGITSAIVIEEGYPLVDLERIRTSMLQACREAHTTVVAGDTKVMGRGEVDASSSRRPASVSRNGQSPIAVCAPETSSSSRASLPTTASP